MSGKVLAFKLPDYTLNVDKDDGFLCLLCGHYTFTDETMWGESFRDSTNCVMHMHGRDGFHYCPNCGAEIITPEEWVERRPQDAGKTMAEVLKTIREVASW